MYFKSLPKIWLFKGYLKKLLNSNEILNSDFLKSQEILVITIIDLTR